MSSRVNAPLTLLDVLRAVIRYRWRSFFTFVILSGLAILAILLFPKKYESQSKLFVRLGRGSVTMDTAATTGQTIAIQESREPEMNSVVDMLQSRQLIERVVRRVGADRILEKHAPLERWIDDLNAMIPEFPVGSTATVDGPAMTEEEVEAQESLELAIKYVAKNTRVESPKKSTTVSVTTRARTSQLAKDLNEAVLDEYNKIHLHAYKADGSLSFFQKNFDQHDALVKQYEDEMRLAKNEMALITISGKQNSLQEQITGVQKDIALTQSDLSAAQSRLRDLDIDMVELPVEIAGEATSGIANAASDTMRSQLYELEIREKDLASKYRDTHPTLVNLRNQLFEARSVLSQQEPERQTSTTQPNPVRQDTHVLLLQEKAAVAGLLAKLDSLKQIEVRLTDELKQVNLFEVKAADLQRRIDLANANHLTYAKKLEESRITSALDTEAISNVSTVQPPTFTMRHVSPKRSVLALLGGFFAFLGSVLVAVASDRFGNDPSAERNALLIQAEERLLRMKAEMWDASETSQASNGPKEVPVSVGADGTTMQDELIGDTDSAEAPLPR